MLRKRRRDSDKRPLSWLRDEKDIRSMYCELIKIKGLKRKTDIFDFKNVQIRELLIVFVYDSEKCKHEADDPQNAILYFYPSWVNDGQRLVLCGQLMGITQCTKNLFSPPSIISLQSGKFSVKIFGHYVLCVGTDRNIPDPVLETRANLLNKLLEFYHSDLLKVSQETGDSFPEKLNRIFEIYLPIMMFGGNYFSTIPLLTLPKSGSTAFLICSQILQYCQKTSGLLGGAVLFQNKVVISQISPELTRLIVLSDPYRIKVPADTVGISFRLPVGMQLFKVFITKKQYSELKNQSMKLISALESVPQWRDSLLKDEAAPVKSLMKRDVSRIFTVPEEDDAGEVTQEAAHACESVNARACVPDVVGDAVQAGWSTRLPPASFVVPDLTEQKASFATTDSIPANKPTPVLPLSFGLPKLNDESMDNDKKNGVGDEMKSYYNTIADPLNPFFRTNGLPASRYLYHERVTNQLRDLTASNHKADENCAKSPALSEVRFSRHQGIPLTPLMSKLSILAEDQKRLENQTSPAPLPSSIDDYPSRVLKETDVTDSSQSGKTSRDFSDVTSSRLDKEVNNTESLDILNVGSSVGSTSKMKRKSINRPGNSECIDENKLSEEQQLVEVVLCVLGRLSTSLVLFLEIPFSKDPNNIHDLWKCCTSKLTELDGQFHRLLDQAPTNGMSAADSYSYICLEPEWGTTRRDGSWTLTQLELLTRLHHDFDKTPSLTDVVVRCDDSLVYGNHCGRKEVFYQQSVGGNSLVGLPNPSDLMGIVPLKAKRRLERDHNIILL